MSDAEWTAWFARPRAEREAIQDKVWATLQAHGVQAGRDMAKANGMPTPPPEPAADQRANPIDRVGVVPACLEATGIEFVEETESGPSV